MTRTPIISLGGGVQSSTMLLMAVHGDLPAPPLAIFADTQWEPPAVYEWVAFLRMTAYRAGIEVATVTAGNIREETVRFARGEGSRYASPPFYVQAPDGDGASILRRQCTKDFKLTPIWRELRRRGFGPKNPVEQWIGISLDEYQRMKPSTKKWATTSWPLIEARMTRHDCERWLTDHGYPIPAKSACIGCPFHDDATWRRMKLKDPEMFADAVAWDREIRNLPRLDSPAFLHKSLTPLDEVDLRNAEDHGQLTLDADQACAEGCFT